MLPEQDLNEKLSKIIEQKKLKQNLVQNLNSVQTKLAEQNDRCGRLSARMKKKQLDIDKLEKAGMSSLFYAVLGQRKKLLENEQQEFITVQSEYREALNRLELLQLEQKDMKQQIDTVAGIDSEYESVFAEKERFLLQSSHDVAEEMLRISEETAPLQLRIKKLTEAIGAGEETRYGLKNIERSLQNAWEVQGRGFVSQHMELSSISDANNCSFNVQLNIAHFLGELEDVARIVDFQMDIGIFASASKVFFDDLAKHWIDPSRILSCLERCQIVRRRTDDILDQLEALQKKTQDKICKLEQKKVLLIENTPS